MRVSALKQIERRLAELEGRDFPSSGNTPDAVAQGDLIIADATPEWAVLSLGIARSILQVNAGGTTFAWVAPDWDELVACSGADLVHSHQSNAEGGQLAVAALTDHNKATHDALNIDADTVDSLHGSQFIRSDADDITTGRTQWNETSNGQAYNAAPIEIIQAWNSGAGEAPHLSFHYSGMVASQIGFMKGDNSGDICILNNPGTGYEILRAANYRVYYGTTLMGELTAQDTTWTRINQNVVKNIYTPRSFCAAGSLTVGSSATANAGDIMATGGLYVGSATNPTTGEITATGDIETTGGYFQSTKAKRGAWCLSANKELVTTGTTYKLNWNTEVVNVGGFTRASSNTQIKFPENGTYRVTAELLVQYRSSGLSIIRVDGNIYKNGSIVQRTIGTQYKPSGTTDHFNTMVVIHDVDITAYSTDYIEIGAIRQSGGTTPYIYWGSNTQYWTMLYIHKIN